VLDAVSGCGISRSAVISRSVAVDSRGIAGSVAGDSSVACDGGSAPAAIPPRDRVGDELAGEPLELGLDLPLDELDELGAAHLERVRDGLRDGRRARGVRHASNLQRPPLPR
jgi:hypothetical protein